MALTTHPCEAEGCQEPVAKDRFMCIRHWRMVPKPLRDEIWALFKGYGRARTKRDKAELLERARALNAVHARAIEAVLDKELKKQAAAGLGQSPLSF